jgi:hypothetical protein
MSNDIEFVNGLTVKQRNENAPDYVLANGSINCEQMLEWLQGRTGWVNWQAKLSKGGKPYVAVDNWKPNGQDKPQQRQERAPSRDASYGDRASGGFEDSEIPFAPIQRRAYW